MTRRLKRAVRAGALVALWLLYASLPLLASVGQKDPFACCRIGGKHHCFMRMHRHTGGVAFDAFVKLCPVAAARTTSTHQAANPIAPLRIQRDLVQTRLLPSAALSVVRSTRTIRSPRAPPFRG